MLVTKTFTAFTYAMDVNQRQLFSATAQITNILDFWFIVIVHVSQHGRTNVSHTNK
jgi:hypothetical protein